MKVGPDDIEAVILHNAQKHGISAASIRNNYLLIKGIKDTAIKQDVVLLALAFGEHMIAENLRQAVDFVVYKENDALAKKYVTAFFLGDPAVVEWVRQEILQTPKTRWENIQQNILIHVGALSPTLLLPIPPFTINRDDFQLSHTLSPQDARTFHEVAALRIPCLENHILKNGEGEDVMRQRNEVFYADMRRWRLESFWLDFSSITDLKLRTNYDKFRGKEGYDPLQNDFLPPAMS